MTHILRWCQECQQNTYHRGDRCLGHRSNMAEQEHKGNHKTREVSRNEYNEY